MQYIADLVPGTKLAPANGTMERYRLQEWLNFITSEIHKAFIPLIYNKMYGRYADYLSYVKPKMTTYFKWIDEILAERLYLLGDDFSVADAYLWVLTNWGRADWIKSVFNTEIDLSGLENIRRWHSLVKRRPSVQEALKAEGLQ